MADQPIINVPSESLIAQVKDLIRRSQGLDATVRRKRIPQPGRTRRTTNELTTSDSGCCCRETECLEHEDQSDTTPIKPQFYAFKMPIFRCNCQPEWGAGSDTDNYLNPVRLYETIDPDIWESDIRQCYGTSQTTVACTATANWVWVPTECFQDCEYSSKPAEFGPPQAWGWINPADPTGHFVAGTPQEVHCEPPADCGCDDAALAAALPPTAPGQTLSIPCIAIDPANGEWQLVGVDDPDCNCTPLPPADPPDWDGTGDPPTAQTTCDGFKVIDATGELVDSFWRLTIVDTKDYYGCFGTKLEWFVGADVVLTYYLENQCGNVRGFCRQCANSFTIFTCGPTQCDVEPEPKICLAPKIADGNALGSYGCCFESTPPATWKVTISGATGWCASLINGTHYLGEIDGSDQRWLIAGLDDAWAYYHFGDRNGFYASADDIPFCDPEVPCGFYGITLHCEGGGMHLNVWLLYNTQGVDPDLGPCGSCAQCIHWYTAGTNDCDNPSTIDWTEDGSTGATVTIEKYIAP